MKYYKRVYSDLPETVNPVEYYRTEDGNSYQYWCKRHINWQEPYGLKGRDFTEKHYEEISEEDMVLEMI